jgi:hypothetical protein
MVVVRQLLLRAVTMVVQRAHTLPLAHRLHILQREQTPQQQQQHITLQLGMVGMAHSSSSSKQQLVVRVRREHSTPSVLGRSATPHTNGEGVFAVSISLVALAVGDAARFQLLFVYSPKAAAAA